MLASTREDEFGALCALAQDAGASTQSTYFVVDAIDARYRQAVAAGAEVVIEIRDEDYGGRGYSARDPEGNLWKFGSYDPRADPTQSRSGAELLPRAVGSAPRRGVWAPLHYAPGGARGTPW